MSNTQEPKANEVFTITAADMPDILNDASDRLDWYIKTFGNRHGLATNVFVSPPGLGKTSISEQQAADRSRAYFDVCGGNMNTSDLRVPAVNWEEQVCRFIGNDELPFVGTNGLEEDSRVFLAWDEMWDAGTLVQRIQKQGLCSNKIGNNRFPINTLQAGFTNGSEHGCYVEKLAASFANRIIIHNVAPDPDVYLEQFLGPRALSIELEVIVRNNKDMFYQIDFKKWNGLDNFGSMRTVTEIAAYFETQLVSHENGKRVFDYRRDPLLRHKLNSLVGSDAMHKIWAFLELMDAIGDFSELMAHPTTHPIPDDLTKKWIVALKLTNEADENNLEAVMTIASRLSGDGGFLEAFVVQSITTHRPKLSSHPMVIKWAKKDKIAICDR